MSGRDKTKVLACAAAGVVAAGAALAYFQKHRRHGFFSSSHCPVVPAPLLESPYVKELKMCIKLAHQAGQNMKGYLNSKGTAEEANFDLGDVDTKSSDIDFCTKVDVENEKLVIQGLEASFPDYDIIGEEYVGTGEIPPLSRVTPTFIIDPIDGTTNFAQGMFMTCVSIGFCVGGSPVMGVVYAPATEEWYIAVSGYGAFRNGVKIHVQTKNKAPLAKAIVCCEFGYSRKTAEIDAMVGAVTRILQHGCRAIRQLGSGVLDLCYVATGRLDAVYAGLAGEGWKPWDYAAGLVICQEAGCIMQSIQPQKPGTDFDLYGKSVLCAGNRELVDDLRKILLA